MSSFELVGADARVCHSGEPSISRVCSRRASACAQAGSLTNLCCAEPLMPVKSHTSNDRMVVCPVVFRTSEPAAGSRRFFDPVWTDFGYFGGSLKQSRLSKALAAIPLWSCNLAVLLFLMMLSASDGSAEARALSARVRWKRLQTRSSQKHHGNSGQLLVRITPLGRDVRHYELRHAGLGADGMPGSWIPMLLTNGRSAIPVNGLIPGTIYAFQVRAFGKFGHTDWSDSATRMCT